MTRQNWSERPFRKLPSMRQESLSEKRFGDLLKSASLFFAAAEGDSEQEKRAAIEDIYALMAEYGLTFDDLK